MKRARLILALLIVLFGISSMRMLYIIAEKENLPDVSNSLRSVVLSERRGEIYDRNMKKLVNRKSENTVVAFPVEASAKILENYISKDEYESLLESIEKREIFICQCDFREENDFIRIAEKFERYTDDGFCSHVVGYINTADNKGVYGIEKSFDEFLTEDENKLVFEYNRSGNNDFLAGGKNGFVFHNYNSQKGISLTIDYNIQRIAENAMKLYGIGKGAVVVMSSENGEIIAMASTPTFNQNDIQSALDDKTTPLVNRALSSYSVGSVFKLVVSAAAIEAGEGDFESYCSGSLEIGNTTFSCSDGIAHGEMNLRSAFAHSCNTYFIRLALKTGSDKVIRMAENLGFDKGFSFAEGFYTSSGNLPYDMATDGNLANLAFGQGGLLATPLQIASCYSAAVNGGTFIEPKLVRSFVSSDGRETFPDEKRYKYRALSADTSEKLKNLLMNNFTEGTCVTAKPEGCIAGGKTSTAQTGWIDENGEEVLHSWFSGFVSCGDEIYTITVFKEDGVSGSIDCGPVFKEISQRLCEIMCK